MTRRDKLIQAQGHVQSARYCWENGSPDAAVELARAAMDSLRDFLLRCEEELEEQDERDPDEDENGQFRECPSCAAKPGSPTLCPECLARRAAYTERRYSRKVSGT